MVGGGGSSGVCCWHLEVEPFVFLCCCQVVEALGHGVPAKCRDGNGLRLPPGEEGAAVHTWQESTGAVNGAHIPRAPPVATNAFLTGGRGEGKVHGFIRPLLDLFRP